MINRLHKTTAVVALAVMLTACPLSNQSSAKKLAVASDAVAHALRNAQDAAQQARMKNIITDEDEARFDQYLTKVAQAGLTLDQAIRANASATDISSKVQVFLDAFNQLQKTGVLELHNADLQIAITTIITGAETSISVIVAAVGGK
jgi:hypothetical protein